MKLSLSEMLPNDYPPIYQSTKTGTSQFASSWHPYQQIRRLSIVFSKSIPVSVIAF